MRHEYQFMEKLIRNIDNLIRLNNPSFHTFISAIYSKELQIEQGTTAQDSAFYVELQCAIQDKQFLYDKYDSLTSM